jgi:signal transduction histidine kinase
MDVDADVDVAHLQGMLRDLVALSAIPTAWIGREPPVVAAGLADALVGLLQLDFAFVRLTDPDGGGAVEARRGSAWARFPDWLEGRLATSAPFPRTEVIPDVGDPSARRCGCAVPVGVDGEAGVVAAACGRGDFPTSRDKLLLSLAANHAAAAFQNARLIHERRQAEEALSTARKDLEVKVAERTAELHLANDELSALRLVATLAAEGVPLPDLFAAVAEEVARVVDVQRVRLVRYESDRSASECATYSARGPQVTTGTRWLLDGRDVLQLVRETAAPARIDDYAGMDGEIAEDARRSGIRSTVGVPVVVAGRVWGALVVSSTEEDPLPEGTAAWLVEFTELLATAIANTESREALARLAEEQAALRRVATLVAQGVRPEVIFSAVSEEVGGLFGTRTAGVVRFDYGGPAIVFVGVSKHVEDVIPTGTRWLLDDALASGQVYRTGQSARIDAVDWSTASGPVAPAGQRLGVVSTVASPIIVEGHLWGAATVSSEEPLPPDADERLKKFTELLATAIANAESRSELAASRRRIVAASDEARHRIERDLHDGTQQRLVSLGLAVRAAEADVPPEQGDLRAELSAIATGLGDVVTDLQELSRGIHPAVLAHGGLGPALRSLVRRSAIPVELDVTTDARFPEPVEVAVYYVASEALANSVKHAQASQVEVSLATRGRGPLLSVRDDGVGGADPARGSGLVGLMDRVEALGGSLRVSSRPGSGTQITATFPVTFPVEPDATGDPDHPSSS